MLFIPLAIVALAGGAYYVKKRKKGMTPERKKIYESALTSLKDPNALRKLSDAFEKEGLKKEAMMLRKRALLRELPADMKAARRAALKKGLNSNDPVAVRKLANAFRNEGATGAALSLERYAAGLKKAS